MKLCWLDIRFVGDARDAIIEEAIHQRVDAIVAAHADDIQGLPPTIKRVLILDDTASLEDLGPVDVVIVDSAAGVDLAKLSVRHPDVEFGLLVEVRDAETLETACTAARTERWCVLDFKDPTKIPLEIVIAAAESAPGTMITMAGDVNEAKVIFGVLEHGSDGVLLAPRQVGDATALRAAAGEGSGKLDLVELTVTAVTSVGMGERACVDTCTYFRQDEGMLVGSYSKGMVLCVSETHPLPYMPTRPFRVNAGAIMSYTLADGERTNYLSELRAGSRILAVDTQGNTRTVTVGRVKIETRPLLSVDAVGPEGQEVNLILQDDWHVRVLAPGAVVRNSTDLRPGDKVLGHLPTRDRHVGYPITELCYER